MGGEWGMSDDADRIIGLYAATLPHGIVTDRGSWSNGAGSIVSGPCYRSADRCWMSAAGWASRSHDTLARPAIP